MIWFQEMHENMTKHFSPHIYFRKNVMKYKIFKGVNYVEQNRKQQKKIEVLRKKRNYFK